MVRFTSVAKLTAAFVIGLASAALITTSLVHADTMSSYDPLEISPLCSNAATGQSFWSVFNKNDASLTLTWNDVEQDKTGTYTAPAHATTTFATFYDQTDPNNRTEFSVDGFATVSRNVQVAACDSSVVVTPPTPSTPCIDGTIFTNIDGIDELHVDGTGTITFGPLDHQPLCADTTVTFSVYQWNDKEDFTPISQQTVTFAKGATDWKTLTYNFPNACVVYMNVLTNGDAHPLNYASDTIYYHNIYAVIDENYGCDTDGNTQPGQGGGDTTPVTPPTNNGGTAAPTTPVTTGGMGGGDATVTPAATPTTITVQPTALANTGNSAVYGTIAAVILMAGGLAATVRRRA